jgi:hypothetical protein
VLFHTYDLVVKSVYTVSELQNLNKRIGDFDVALGTQLKSYISFCEMWLGYIIGIPKQICLFEGYSPFYAVLEIRTGYRIAYKLGNV